MDRHTSATGSVAAAPLSRPARLLVLACSATKRPDPDCIPALARYDGPLWRTLRAADCRDCSLRPHCTRSKSARRAITIRPEAQHEALRVRREREKTSDFAAEYARRAGVEGTIAQGVRSARLRRTPYFGHAKTHMAHLIDLLRNCLCCHADLKIGDGSDQVEA